MASYEIEHNIKDEPKKCSTRPDMSSFFSAYEQASSSSTTRNNPHAAPTPIDIEIARDLLGSSLRVRADEIARMPQLDADQRASFESVLDYMMTETSGIKKIEGVPQSYLDELERVDRRALKKGMQCPICAVDFLDDEYPLVVRLPCHRDHWFDLECIGPWLMMKSTCPLDRKDLLAKKEVPKPTMEEEEEDYDDYYA